MTGCYLRRQLNAAVLVLPLLAFIVVFFIWPLFTVMKESVSDPAISSALPRTSELASDWDRTSEVPDALRQALIQDLRVLDDDRIIGDVTRRLNSAQSGFRTLLPKTISAVREAPEASLATLSLEAVDRRWKQLPYWQAIVNAASPYTDRNLLAAVDMERNTAGEIVSLPEGASANLEILLRTLWVSGTVMLICILIGLPYAMLIASLDGWKRQVALVAVLIPLWTSLLVRTSAWYILLQDTGLINQALMGLGLTDSPVHLIFNRLGVIIAMVHVLLPLMVLPIYSVLIGLPRNLMPAAATLGAMPLRAFYHVLLPLTARGIASGGLLVFISAIGYYITPALIGGAKDQLISSVIAFYALNSANWGMASALGLVLLVATLLLYGVYNRFAAEKGSRP